MSITPESVRAACLKVAERAIKAGICERVTQMGTPEGVWKIAPEQLISPFYRSEIKHHVAAVSEEFSKLITPLVDALEFYAAEMTEIVGGKGCVARAALAELRQPAVAGRKDET